jgi:hypothetical protein
MLGKEGGSFLERYTVRGLRSMCRYLRPAITRLVVEAILKALLKAFVLSMGALVSSRLGQPPHSATRLSHRRQEAPSLTRPEKRGSPARAPIDTRRERLPTVDGAPGGGAQDFDLSSDSWYRLQETDAACGDGPAAVRCAQRPRFQSIRFRIVAALSSSLQTAS